jgi:chitodextrinase
MAEQAFLATTAEGLTVPLGPGAAPMTGGIDGTTVSEPTGSPTTRRPPATGPPTGPPPAPASVDASDGEDGASTVSWAAVGGDGVEYEVQLVEEPQRVRSAGAGTSLRWTGLSNGARYRFRVRAITASGTGRWSDASLAVTPTGPRPAIMVNRAEVAGSTVTVDFSTSACTVARLTGPGSGHAFPGWPNDGSQCRTSFSHTITGLAPATRYVFSIEVRDPPGPHRVVQTIRFATPPDPVPPTPEPPPPTPDPVPPTPDPPPPTPDPPPPTPEPPPPTPDPPPPTPGGDDPPPPDGTDDDASPVTGPPNVLVVHSDAATDADAGPDG